MTAEYNQYTLECGLTYGGFVRMNFASKEQAEAAQAQIADGMSKGKYQSDDIVHIISDGSSYDIRTSDVMSVSVNDGAAWMSAEKRCRDHRESLGLPNPKIG